MFWNNSKIEEMLPSEEEERKMYIAAQEILKKNGYMQYEISKKDMNQNIILIVGSNMNIMDLV